MTSVIALYSLVAFYLKHISVNLHLIELKWPTWELPKMRSFDFYALGNPGLGLAEDRHPSLSLI